MSTPGGPAGGGSGKAGYASSSPDLERWLRRHIGQGFNAEALVQSMCQSGYDAGFARATVGAALAAMRDALARHRVSVSGLAALPLVECDAVLMERVLCNLLENAAKYTPAGTAIRVSGELADTEVRLVVADQGPGVPRGQEQSIFQKFTRGERESATAGVGLGLAVCEAIVQAHGGRIWVESAGGDDGEGRGARFVVALPRGTPPAVEPEAAAAGATHKEPH